MQDLAGAKGDGFALAAKGQGSGDALHRDGVGGFVLGEILAGGEREEDDVRAVALKYPLNGWQVAGWFGLGSLGGNVNDGHCAIVGGFGIVGCCAESVGGIGGDAHGFQV